MNIKIYDRDARYTADEVLEAQQELNSYAAGISVDRMTTLGRFELALAADLTTDQQTDFIAWAAANYPDWEVVIR